MKCTGVERYLYFLLFLGLQFLNLLLYTGSLLMIYDSGYTNLSDSETLVSCIISKNQSKEITSLAKLGSILKI